MTVPETSPAELLTQALEHLEPDDRQRVTAWVLSRMSGGSAGWPVGPGERTELLRGVAEGGEPRALYSASYPGQSFPGDRQQGTQVVPVRLPVELHARLRQWSTANGFSMATVVRGLVGRFLDGQGRLPAEPAGVVGVSLDS